MRWTKIERRLGGFIEDSASTQRLPRELWPANTEAMRLNGQRVVDMFAYAAPSTTALTRDRTRLQAVGGLELFRQGDDALVKADRWLVARTTGGEYYQKGPYKNLPHSHHSTGFPEWARRGRS